MMAVGRLTSLLLAAAVLLLPSAATAHAPGLFFAAFGTPVVDGTLSPGEWEAAARHAFRANAPGGGTVAGELLVMNDELKLYFAVRLETVASTTVAAAFDNDHDGVTPEEGDDGFALDDLDRLFDTVRSRRGGCPAGAICARRDPELGGTNDVAAVRALHGVETHIELWHPLDSADDANDFSARAGHMLGFGFQVGICTAPLTCVLTQAVPFTPMGDLLVAEPVAPETAISDGPAEGAVVASASASFVLTGTDNVDTPAQLAFTCRLDDGPFTACASPASYGALADGTHRFAVRAHDRSRNVDDTPATRTWTVDATPPDTTLQTRPPALTRERSATLTFSGEDALTAAGEIAFLCVLDGAEPVLCTSPHALAGLRDGRHTIAVQAVDRAGNRDPTAAAHEWTVDATSPTRPRIRGPRSTASRRPTYRFSARDAITPASDLEFRCGIDGRALRPCAPVVRPRLRPGRHVLRAAAEDEAGNRSSIASVRIVVRAR